ncbi:zinc-binding protein A33 [Denticeps clupeoides]|uniref:Tripartite motif-containing protein 35-like n=1 Tax=Denticeps clupeoides TaxID=299321 RepID=A0AAY4B7C2_9TELE|nr:zinc-binding protein A33-like [Denticeps clupeoides]XP_028810361.1 zinc-binding protein A33-like [Denticeps clupeoides]
MAARISLVEEDLSCSICCSIFKDPVVLKCSHSFCAACLQQYWEKKGPAARDCPLCRRESADEPVVSLTLKNLCDSWVQEEDEDEQGGEDEPGERCRQHGERLKLFCLVDRLPICMVCHTSKKHKQHDCCPVEEAMVDIKEDLRCALTVLQGKLEAFEKMKRNYETTAEHIKAQAEKTEALVREEFEKLHQFLRGEEAARIAELKQEERRKSQTVSQRLDEIFSNMASLSDSVRAIEEELQIDDLSFLHKCKKTLKRAECVAPEPIVASGSLIDVARYLGSLRFRVWEKMQEVVQFTPVVLDPNTAAPWLILSDVLTSVRDCDSRQPLPDNPERFDPDTGVLGSVGFSSGSHWWDVEVGENTAWVLGVAKESVQRKEKVSSVLKNGYLTVYYYHKMYFAGTSPLTRLSLKRRPSRVRVALDWDRGRLTFSDADDNTPIYTFRHAFAETVFPYFWVGCKACPLRIQPRDVAVTTEHK